MTVWYQDPSYLTWTAMLGVFFIIVLSWFLFRGYPKPKPPTGAVPKEPWWKRYGGRIAIAMLLLGALIYATKFLLPGVWQWWHDERTMFFWASVVILAIAIFAFLVGNKLGKIVGVAAVLLLVVGFAHNILGTSTPKAQTAAFKPPQNTTNCDMNYRRVKLLPGKRFPFSVKDCAVWFEVVDPPPKGVHIYAVEYDWGGREYERLLTGSGGYWRGMPFSIDIPSGQLRLMPRVPDIVEIEYRRCPKGAVAKDDGCVWKGWHFFGEGQRPLKLAP